MKQTLSTPHVLAAECLFGRDTVYPYTAVAEGPCGILQLLKSDYIKMVNTDKVFLFNILNYLSSGSQRSASSALAVSDGSVAGTSNGIVSTPDPSARRRIMRWHETSPTFSRFPTQRAGSRASSAIRGARTSGP